MYCMSRNVMVIMVVVMISPDLGLKSIHLFNLSRNSVREVLLLSSLDTMLTGEKSET